jgi:uncharacterized protein (DUF1684 family)
MIYSILSLWLLFPCAGSDLPGKDMSWQEKLELQRAEKDDAFKHDRRSPMFGFDRYSYQDATEVSVSLNGGKLLVEDSTQKKYELAFQYIDGFWHWTQAEGGVEVFSDQKQVPPGKFPSGSEFRLKPFTLSVYTSGQKIALICFDPEREAGKTFTHLRYYPPSRKYLVQAEMKKLTKADKVIMLTSQNQEKTYYRYAELHFVIDGKDLTLMAYKMSLSGEESHFLFVPFTDVTTGKETYGAGRYLELEEPSSHWITLDFNLAFNPLCNYSPAYNCPVPLAENDLLIPILAGEKTYPLH